jgi:uncharacterized membrane protein
MSSESGNHRLEAFCDGVFAIAITLLVLEIKIPPIASIHSIPEFWHEIFSDWPSWFGFSLSFVIILISWVNHHNIFKLLNRSGPHFIYANGLLLFTVAALPYSTGVMSDYLTTDFAQPAVTIYCFTIFAHSVAWMVFLRAVLGPIPLIHDPVKLELFTKTVVNSNKYAVVLYLALCIISFWLPVTAMILMTCTWVLWIVTSILLHPKEEDTSGERGGQG